MTIIEEDVHITGIDVDGDVSCQTDPPDERPAVARISYSCPVPSCAGEGKAFLCRLHLDGFLNGEARMFAWCPAHGNQRPIPGRYM